MKRQLKFRAWHNGAKQMLYENRVGDVFKWYQEHQPIEIMQLTGLLDKNGKEIYDKDVIYIQAGNPYDIIDGRHVVEWYLSGWYIKQCDGVDYTDVDFSDLSLYNYVKASEVIGNVHQNPELL